MKPTICFRSVVTNSVCMSLQIDCDFYGFILLIRYMVRTSIISVPIAQLPFSYQSKQQQPHLPSLSREDSYSHQFWSEYTSSFSVLHRSTGGNSYMYDYHLLSICLYRWSIQGSTDRHALLAEHYIVCICILQILSNVCWVFALVKVDILFLHVKMIGDNGVISRPCGLWCVFRITRFRCSLYSPIELYFVVWCCVFLLHPFWVGLGCWTKMASSESRHTTWYGGVGEMPSQVFVCKVVDVKQCQGSFLWPPLLLLCDLTYCVLVLANIENASAVVVAMVQAVSCQ